MPAPVRTYAQIEADLADAERRLDKLIDEAHGAEGEALDRLQTGIERMTEARDRFFAEKAEWNRRRVAALAGMPGHAEGPFVPPTTTLGPTRSPIARSVGGPSDTRSEALRAVERLNLAPRAADRLDAIIRSEPTPAYAAQLVATSSELYASAFQKVLFDPQRAPFLLTDQERIALSDATTAMRATAMTIGTPADGGYLLPSQLDPSIILTNDGSTNPLRRISTVKTLTQKTGRYITSDGVTAAYGQEGTDVSATNPTLAPVDVVAQRGAAYLELSYEMVQDWQGAASELARLFADARDNLEAEMFLHGRPTQYEPAGLISVGLTPDAGLPTSVQDYISAQNSLPARWQANSRWLMGIDMINAAGQLVAEADASDAKIIDANGNLLRRPIEEASYAGSDVVLGDFKAGFYIGDRLGISLTPIPVVYNGSTNLPSGKTGYLMIWRSGCQVAIPDAFVLLGLGS